MSDAQIDLIGSRWTEKVINLWQSYLDQRKNMSDYERDCFCKTITNLNSPVHLVNDDGLNLIDEES